MFGIPAVPEASVPNPILPRSVRGCELPNFSGDARLGSHARMPRPFSRRCCCRNAQHACRKFILLREFEIAFQIALPRQLYAIILRVKAGIDPVGASYPKVSCPP